MYSAYKGVVLSLVQFIGPLEMLIWLKINHLTVL